MALIDPFGREITDLRISVTDGCNFRCFYCLPQGAFPASRCGYSLQDAEIRRIVNVGAELGISKIRITGGEPLLRKGLSELVRTIRQVPEIRTVALTTNGSFLRQQAQALQAAGLSYATVSLDSLRRDRFAEICGKDELAEVLAGIQAARSAGLVVKINAVLLRNRTESEIFDFVDLADTLDLPVRFIECMPFTGNGWSLEGSLLAPEAKRILSQKWRLLPLSRQGFSETSENYRIEGRRGSIGFIASVSSSFCDRCSRIRLTADGFLKPCLHGEAEVDLKPALQTKDDAQLREGFLRAVLAKPWGHPDWRDGERVVCGTREMVRIGG